MKIRLSKFGEVVEIQKYEEAHNARQIKFGVGEAHDATELKFMHRTQS